MAGLQIMERTRSGEEVSRLLKIKKKKLYIVQPHSRLAMDENINDNDTLVARVQQLENVLFAEHDELHKDIEQLCMQNAGPGYLAVATRIHFQRTAALEQEIENLKKVSCLCKREFKSSRGAFRGISIKAEKAKEKEDSMFQKLNDLEKSVEELARNFLGGKKVSVALWIDLEKQEKQNENFKKVVNSFYEIRQHFVNGNEDTSWEDKCDRLLRDSAEMWSFNDYSTSKYITDCSRDRSGDSEKICG